MRDISRYLAFVNTSPEDHAKRRDIITADDLAALYSDAAEQPDLWPLYRQVTIVRRADSLLDNPAVATLGIETIRRHLFRAGEFSQQTERGLIKGKFHDAYWPLFRVLIYDAVEDCAKMVHRLGIVPFKWAPTAISDVTGWRRELHAAACQLLQQFRGNDRVAALALGDPVDHAIVTIAGQPLDFQLLNAYRPLIERGSGRGRDDARSLVFEAAVSYDDRREARYSPEAHFANRLRTGMRTMRLRERPVRLLEPPGASVQHGPLSPGEARRLVDAAVKDATDAAIAQGLLLGDTQAEIAAACGLSQSAVSQRVAKMRARIAD